MTLWSVFLSLGECLGIYELTTVQNWTPIRKCVNFSIVTYYSLIVFAM